MASDALSLGISAAQINAEQADDVSDLQNDVASQATRLLAAEGTITTHGTTLGTLTTRITDLEDKVGLKEGVKGCACGGRD